MEDWLTKALDKATDKKLVKDVESLMRNKGFSLEDACDALDASVAEYKKAKKLLSAETAATV